MIDSSSDRNVSGVYLLGCSITGKVYIGRSAKIGGRVMAHVYTLRKQTHYNKSLQSDFVKYGEDSFYYKVVEEVSADKLKGREDFHILSFSKTDLYNRHRSSNTGASSNVISNETRLKLSLRQKGDKNHFYGKKHSAETLKRMSESAFNRVRKS